MSSTSQSEPRRGRGRPRTPGAEERILDAALQEYGEQGWSGFTMDGVARRAGVGKSTVYLRWQDKDSLLTDAVATRIGGLSSVDTGSLRGDLEEIAGNLFRHYSEPGGWASLRIVIDSAGVAKPLGQFVLVVTTVQVDMLERVITRACERGELAGNVATAATAAIAEFVYGSVAMQMIGIRLEGRTLDEADIRDRASLLVTILLSGVLAWRGPDAVS